MTTRIAVIGGGPIGIETAALLEDRGFDVTVFERGAPGAHVARWGHVNFFSPWRLNRSPWGTRILRESGHELADEEDFPTGDQYLTEYLKPLAKHALEGRIRTMTEVRGVSRSDAWKGDFIGDDARAAAPFVLAVSGPEGEDWVEADVVIDASGVYQNPNPLGPGGLPAFGEDAVGDLVERWIPDVLGRDRELYAGKQLLVVGDGHSASTTLRILTRLREEAPETTVYWALRGGKPPYVVLEDDPLPERRALSEFGNRAAASEIDGIEPIRAAKILRLSRHGEQARVTIDAGGEERELTVDRIVANVGYRPDLEMSRELQVHLCYASEGPMKLAASLLAQSGNADCLVQESAGVDTLRNPEPGFFVLGSKSYGRNSNFLLRVGFEQIEAIADTLQ
jgi:cation diffusion facilitator CzcD-associated flavoprotein CzcO